MGKLNTDSRFSMSVGSESSGFFFSSRRSDPDPTFSRSSDPDQAFSRSSDPEPVFFRSSDPDPAFSRSSDPNPDPGKVCLSRIRFMK